MPISRADRAIARLCIGAAALLSAVPARANLVITPIFSSDFSNEAKAVVNDAIAFYTTNITGNTSIVVGFALQPGGGASALTSFYGETYTDYVARLRGNATESATDVSALKTLPATAPVGNGRVNVTTTLAVQLGLATSQDALPKAVGGNCGSMVANACVSYGAAYNTIGTPTGGFFGVTQHELDEVLGTSSALSGEAYPVGSNGVNTTGIANTADLFRYSAAGVRSFSTNPGTSTCQNSSPIAYLSVDGGVTNLVNYNNCANGGDYGDFAVRSTKDAQVYTGDESSPSSLNLASPEVTLLDAIGYNFATFKTVASGTPVVGTSAILSTTTTSYGGDDDGIFAEAEEQNVPEPASLAVLAFGAVSTALARRRRIG